MSPQFNPHLGERVTFRTLFDRHPIVEIPIIQRDYAQGRTSEFEVRTEFLKALHTALSKPERDPSLPLDLDFVYGSVESMERTAFCPLDGQQRLTTLFLLHWYLAWKERRGEDFAAFIKTNGKSRFSYSVRPSSQEFFDALVCWHPDTSPVNVLSLSWAITDQPWFYRSWKLDPTIQCSLTMLDAIHDRFSLADGFYDRLVKTDHPYITFQLLDLQSFGLSDDLYIKMNARGKPLTPFETFKARLEQHLDTIFPERMLELHGKQVSIKDYFSHRIDTAWADLFWYYRDEKTHLFDDKIMHLLRALSIVTRPPDKAGIEDVLETLRDDKVSFSFLKYQEHQCLDRTLIDTFISILDSWCGSAEGLRTHLNDTAYYDEKRTFERVVNDSTKLSYEDLVQFHAYCAYLRKHRDNLQAKPFGEWMRVICNLAVNTIYDRLEDFKRSIRSVNELLNESNRILEHLSGTAVEVQGFNEQQIREEKLKAQLILRSNDWRLLILKAEQHGYFKGQIEFLFKFSGVLDRWVGNSSADWSAQEDLGYRKEFADYFAKAATVFSADGLNDFGESRWERALLSIGNYLLPKRRNDSFLTDSDRDASWKRLLRGAINYGLAESRRGYVKELLDKIDLSKGVKESLEDVIQNAKPPERWCRLVVERPEMIEYCRSRMIRWQSENSVYLLRKSQMNGEHADLFSYHLKVGLLSAKYDKGELVPFGKPSYYPVSNESDVPRACLEWKSDHGNVVLDVSNEKGAYLLELFNRDGELDDQIKEGFIAKLSFTAQGSMRISLMVGWDKVESAIDDVVRLVRTLAQCGTLKL